MLASAQDEFKTGIGYRHPRINRKDAADVLPTSRADVMDCFQRRTEHSGAIDLPAPFHNR